jgi:hypothetical protein
MCAFSVQGSAGNERSLPQEDIAKAQEWMRGRQSLCCQVSTIGARSKPETMYADAVSNVHADKLAPRVRQHYPWWKDRVIKGLLVAIVWTAQRA